MIRLASGVLGSLMRYGWFAFLYGGTCLHGLLWGVQYEVFLGNQETIEI